MSCKNGTSPIDISKQYVSGDCQGKCSYYFKYAKSNCVATNQTDYISLSYDNPSSNPVRYNNANYVVDKIRIYFPSLHSYNGKRVAGEFVISHTPVLGGNTLLVCIPIKPTNVMSPSGMMLAKVIDNVASKAPRSGETVNISTNFDLNILIPKAPYFSYTATLPYQPCSGTADFVVFNMMTGAFDISTDVLAKLKGVIQQHKYDVKKGTMFFYNKTGPSFASESELYMECTPAGSGGEQINVTSGGTSSNSESSTSSSSDDSSSNIDFNSDTAWTIYYVVFCVLVILGMFKVYMYLFGGKTDTEGAQSMSIFNVQRSKISKP